MRLLVSILQVLLGTVAMAATPIDGLYTSIIGGYVYMPPNIDHAVDTYTLNSARYQSGFEAGGNFGYKSNPMRYEAEVTYLKANIDHFYLNGVKQTGAGGYNQGIFGMANVYFDLPMMNPELQPFVGAGIGYGWVQAKFTNTAPTALAYDGTNSTFAYQVTPGVTFNFAENYALSLSYRYLATSTLSALGEIFQVHMANLGATYRFDEANYK